MMCGLIDLNDDTVEATTSYASPSVNLSLFTKTTSSYSTPVVCSLELWHACAGPRVSLPKKGNAVVYLPQGHLEQHRIYDSPLITGVNLPPHVFCRVVDVKLHAEKGSDQVVAQVSLIPDSQLEKKLGETEVEEDDNGGTDEKPTTPHMFCKTLTASDTSTHGGFSVPRRAAEDCFPPLDYSQPRPSQELVAKDLHGTEWKFRHIYRGQPRRHLLTTGWSAFINHKKLVCGDAVLFLRGDDGVLRLGVRRAVQLKSSYDFPVNFGRLLNDSNFNTIVKSISQKTVFNVCYNPRSGSKFIVPYHRFRKCLTNKFSLGTRFNLRFETEDATERRCRGIITGISDIDPVNWPGSKWRCLTVKWDGVEATRQNRLSPWEIEGHTSVTGSAFDSISSPVSKRIKTDLRPEFHVPEDGAGGSLDFKKSSRFPKVLQGQEICSLRSLTGKPDVGSWAPPRPDLGTSHCNILNMYRTPENPGFYPLGSTGGRNFGFPHPDVYEARLRPSPGPDLSPGPGAARGMSTNFTRYPVVPPSVGSGPVEKTVVEPNSSSEKDDGASDSIGSSCKLFGFHLNEAPQSLDAKGSNKRSCTKVHKQGNKVGRAIDLSKMSSYRELFMELEVLFNMEGAFNTPNGVWRLLYTDEENDMMVVGDDPWDEFARMATKIHIYTAEEVEKLMSSGVISDNTSCLEEPPATVDTAKSSSVG
uniref:Auxin response factor n=1 Tax=Helianthus tuberosus TaxID=4233 RepID=A0A6C0QJP7_HELTU|nr:auxin response factor [Helianthus tuberosus]